MNVTHTYLFVDETDQDHTELTTQEEARALVEQFDWSSHNFDITVNIVFSTDNGDTICISKYENGTYWCDFQFRLESTPKKLLGFIPVPAFGKVKTAEFDKIPDEKMSSLLNDFFNEDQETLISRYCD